MNITNKLIFLIPKAFRYRAVYLSFLMLLGMILESFGLGLLLPIVNFIVEPEILNKYPEINSFFLSVGINSNLELIVLAMLFFSSTYLLKTVLLLYISYKQADFSQDIAQTTSSKLFESYLKQDYIINVNTNSATLIRNTVAEIAQLTTVIQNGLLLITELAISLSILITLLYIDLNGALSVFVFFFIFRIFSLFNS